MFQAHLYYVPGELARVRCAAPETKFSLVYQKIEVPAPLVPPILLPYYLTPLQYPFVETLGRYFLTVVRGWYANDAYW